MHVFIKVGGEVCVFYYMSILLSGSGSEACNWIINFTLFPNEINVSSESKAKTTLYNNSFDVA